MESRRPLLERGLRRTTEAPLVHGSEATLLLDAPMAYPVMLAMIDGATRRIHFENYIIRDDGAGRRFADALAARARAGVEVRILYDWWGCHDTPSSYWDRLREAGCQVREFGRPSLREPLSALRRDHRKLLVVDGQVAVVGGLCIGDEWLEDGEGGCWRDTAVRVAGPAARAVDAGFCRMWRRCGGDVVGLEEEGPPPTTGGVAARVIDGIPLHGRVYRLYQLVAALAERRLFLTGAYPLAPRALGRALASAARGGVDVRLLVAGRSDLPWVNHAGRAQYEGLLRAGIRIYEWTGPMLHAKTMVADGWIALIGSSNLNPFSLHGCYELDIEVQDAGFARQLEDAFLADLERAREIVLPEWRRRSVAQKLRERAAAVALWLPYKLYSA